MNKQAEVLIVGGGIVGSSIAYYLCKKGLRPLVLEAVQIGHGGSSRNGGGVRQSARDPRELPLMMYGVQNIWPTLSDELGVDTEYTQKGNLRLGKTPAHIEKLTALTNRCTAAGLEMRMLSQEQAKAVNPYLSEEVIGASWCATDGHANPMTTTLGFYRAARRLGAQFITGEEAAEIRVEKGRAARVITKLGNSYSAPSIVIAAGFESRALFDTVGIDLPMGKILDECLVTESAPPMFEQMLGTADADFYGHQSQHHGSFVFGGDDGFLDYTYTQPSTANTSTVSPVICRGVMRYFPVLSRLKIVRSWGGWLDMTTDGVPVLGAVDEIPGLFAACGFNGHGFGLGPAAGYEMAELIATGKTGIDLSALRYSRFVPAK